ncbi:MAG: GNAT family N-acetyltransferase [Mesorhizobium sp.]
MADAPVIARVLRRSLESLAWMPKLHTPTEDLAFISEMVLPRQSVIVAETGCEIVGFVAAHQGWLNLLYLNPEWTGQGIGGRLLEMATAGAGETKLYCFQANAGARRFYERHGFRAAAFSAGSANEEGLPDVLYTRRG